MFNIIFTSSPQKAITPGRIYYDQHYNMRAGTAWSGDHALEPGCATEEVGVTRKQALTLSAELSSEKSRKSSAPAAPSGGVRVPARSGGGGGGGCSVKPEPPTDWNVM